MQCLRLKKENTEVLCCTVEKYVTNDRTVKVDYEGEIPIECFHPKLKERFPVSISLQL